MSSPDAVGLPEMHEPLDAADAPTPIDPAGTVGTAAGDEERTARADELPARPRYRPWYVAEESVFRGWRGR